MTKADDMVKKLNIINALLYKAGGEIIGWINALADTELQQEAVDAMNESVWT